LALRLPSCEHRLLLLPVKPLRVAGAGQVSDEQPIAPWDQGLIPFRPSIVNHSRRGALLEVRVPLRAISRVSERRSPRSSRYRRYSQIEFPRAIVSAGRSTKLRRRGAVAAAAPGFDIGAKRCALSASSGPLLGVQERFVPRAVSTLSDHTISWRRSRPGRPRRPPGSNP